MVDTHLLREAALAEREGREDDALHLIRDIIKVCAHVVMSARQARNELPARLRIAGFPLAQQQVAFFRELDEASKLRQLPRSRVKLDGQVALLPQGVRDLEPEEGRGPDAPQPAEALGHGLKPGLPQEDGREDGAVHHDTALTGHRGPPGWTSSRLPASPSRSRAGSGRSP